jgi:alkyl sulfatase BDS1-like metallo-beta-lactamase superfamily hydrolase
MAPNSEAPAEMHFFVPRYKLLNLAENCTHNFHNLLPFRGADVRDALAWSKYLGEALQMWGGKADAMCGQHHWPVWGRERIDTMIRQQRDLYKFAHDQTIRLMNHGLTAAEIAEAIKLPASLDGAWHARGYYGHIRHNVKAIYQKYLGWYDANPVNLDPLPPVESGRKYVEYMGGADAILARAAGDFAKGEFRFVAQAVSHLVFAEPNNHAARDARRYVRAARLCLRKFDLAQRLSVRRAGIATGHAQGAAALDNAARNAGGVAHRTAMGRARRAPQRPQGRRQAHRAELEFYRHE